MANFSFDYGNAHWTILDAGTYVGWTDKEFIDWVSKGVLIVGGEENKTIRGRVVNGTWTLDKTFDGKTNTKAKGVIYIDRSRWPGLV